MEFWSQDRYLLGTKNSLQDLISQITGIPTEALSGRLLSTFSVNERLRWATHRQTRRREDKAYSLLGIFGVFMPLIYGEDENALVRLREAIARTHGAGSSDVLTAGIGTQGAVDDPMELHDDSGRWILRSGLLKSLVFTTIDERRSTIRSAERTTCEWILQHPAVAAWNVRHDHRLHRGILWIVGKPGSGKSTLMKFMLAQAQRSRQRHQIVVSFFFNARGETLEKTTYGMYRSILYQLLNAAPHLQSVLDHVDSFGDLSAAAHRWTLDEVQNILCHAVELLAGQHIRVYIDALDECDEREVRSMIKFFEDLEEQTIADAIKLDICFASRHYPTVHVDYGWRVVLEHEAGHAADLRSYVRRCLRAGKGKEVSDIQAEILGKASGVFLWVALVVDILNTEFERGRIFAVKTRLSEIPVGLSDLFKDILQRDRVNMDDLLLSLQWILFAKRPLSREEYYFAMVTGLRFNRECDGSWQPSPWDPVEVTTEDMDRFVLSSSKGLATVTQSETPKVQFIHESVQDFLLKDGGLRNLWPALGNLVESFSHEKLKICCYEYLNADLTGLFATRSGLWQSSEAQALQATTMSELEPATLRRMMVDRKFPFHRYASTKVFYHAENAAGAHGQVAFLRGFALRPWIEAFNVHQQSKTSEYAFATSMLVILAEGNYASLIHTMLPEFAESSSGTQSSLYAVAAAFALGHREALRALLGTRDTALVDAFAGDPGFGASETPLRGENLLKWAAENGDWSMAEYLRISLKDARRPWVPSAYAGVSDRDYLLAKASCVMASQPAAKTLVIGLLSEAGCCTGFTYPHKRSLHRNPHSPRSTAQYTSTLQALPFDDCLPGIGDWVGELRVPDEQPSFHL